MNVKTSTQNLIRCLCFLTLFLIIFQYFNKILERQTLEGSWNYTVKVGGFYEQEPQSIELIALGSSHMYCTMVPNEIWQSSKINSYVLSTQEQTFEMTYYYLMEALKTQRPKVVVLETHMFHYDTTTFHDAVVSNAIEPLRWSMNKVEFITKVVPQEVQLEYFFPIFKYHSMWSTLDDSFSLERYDGQSDPYRGYTFLNETHNAPDFTTDITPVEIDVKEEDMIPLQNIIALTQKENIQLVLLHAPTQMSDLATAEQAYLKEYAIAQKIPYLDMNEHLDEMGIDVAQDFFDAGHLNIKGAQKASRYLTNYLEEFITFDKKYSSITIDELEQANKNYQEVVVP